MKNKMGYVLPSTITHYKKKKRKKKEKEKRKKRSI
jgi:hypothetical protein